MGAQTVTLFRGSQNRAYQGILEPFVPCCGTFRERCRWLWTLAAPLKHKIGQHHNLLIGGNAKSLKDGFWTLFLPQEKL